MKYPILVLALILAGCAAPGPPGMTMAAYTDRGIRTAFDGETFREIRDDGWSATTILAGNRGRSMSCDLQGDSFGGGGPCQLSDGQQIKLMW